MNLPNVSGKLFDELLITVESIGIEQTVKTLKEARTSLNVQDLDHAFILNTVSEITGITVATIIHGNSRSDDRKLALSLSVYFIKKQIPAYSFTDMGKIFGKDSSCLWRYHNNVLKIPKTPKSEFDKKLSKYVKEIELKITREKN